MATIRVAETGIPSGILSIASQLPDPRQVSAGDNLTISFIGGEFLYLTGLVLLAAWRKALPAGATVSIDDHSCSEGIPL